MSAVAHAVVAQQSARPTPGITLTTQLAGQSALLPAGVVRVNGKFERGDAVRVVSLEQKAVAIGLSNYSAADVQKIIGHKSGEIQAALGFTFGDEVIHRDHMALL